MDTTLDTLTAAQLTRVQGLDAARWIRCLYDSDDSELVAAKTFIARHSDSLHVDIARTFLAKAAADPGTTHDGTWAAPLSMPVTFAQALVTLARPATIIGRIPTFRRAPFNVNVPAQTSGATFNWAGQGNPKPVGQAAYAPVLLGFAKASGILVVTTELIRSTSPSADRTLRDELVAGLAAFLDEQFVDPSVAEVTNVSPGSILEGLSPLVSSGAPHLDLTRLISTFVAASPETTSLVFLLSPTNAAVLASSGHYPDLRLDGGFIFGVPAVTSAAMEDRIALIDPTRLLLADDNGLDVSLSRQADVQMNTVPDSPATASTVLVSLWQYNLVGLRVERFINWKRAVDSAVQFIDNVSYIGGSPA